MRTFRNRWLGAAALALSVALPTAAPAARAAESTGPRVYHMCGSRGWITYSLDRKVGGGAVAIEIYYRRDGGDWVKYGEDRKLETGRMIFKVPDEGVYDIATVAVDAAGNREKKLGADTPAEYRLVVDRTPPKLKARREFPLEDRAVPAGRIRFSWEAADANLDRLPVTVQVRVRGEPDWQPVRDSSSAGKTGEILRLAAKGSRNFQALSAAAARLYRGALEVRFRATDRAGNRKYSEVLQLPIDRVAPVAVALGPVLAARREVPVLYRVEDEGRAGVDEVTAWVSPDQGRSWLKAGSAPAARGTVPIKLEKPGVYGLYVTARDRAGNEGAAPRPGTKPQLIMLIDSAAPRAALAGCLIVRADRRRHADGKLDRNQRVELLGSLKSYPDGADIRQWIKNNPGLWAAIFKDHDRNTDGKLDGDELGTLTEHLRHPMTFAEIGDLGGRVFSSSQVLLLKWKVSDDYLPEKEALKVEFSADGGDSWRAVAAGLKNEKTRTGDAQRDERDSYDASFTGSLLWSPPTVNSRRCLLRLRAKDRAGNETVVLSRIFAVDNRAPKSGVDGFEPIRDPGGATGREEGDKPETPAPGALKPPASRPHVEDLLTMAYQCLKAGMRRQAAEKAAEAVKRDPENLAGHLLLGRALAGSDDEAALKYLLRAEKLAPEAEGLAEDLAHVCLRLGCKRAGQGRVRSAHALLTRSADCFQKVLAVRGTGASHYNLGLALLYSARTSKNPASLRARARRALSEAVRLGRDNRAIYAHAHWWLAVLDEEDHRFREAARLWESAAKIYGAESEMGKRSLARARSARRRR